MNLNKFLKNFWWSLTAFKTMDDLPDSLVFVSSNGYIEHFNSKAHEVFGLNNQDDISIRFDDIVENGMEKIKESIRGAKPILTSADIPGRKFYVEMNVSKKVGGFCVSLRDMTKLTNEIVNDEKTLKFNNEKNAMLVKLQDDVISPITSISGFSQGLIDGLGGELTEKQAKYVKIIKNNADDLSEFLDKLFEFSQVESSIYDSDYRNFDIVEAFKTILKELNTKFEQKKISYDFDYDAIDKRTVYTDLNAVKRIFKNIVETALSMTETGYVEVKLSYPEETSCGNYKINIPPEKLNSYMNLTIQDTGAGFAEEEMKYLCEPYAQLEKGKRNLKRALKLGTASILTKRINGVICISSEVMKGTKYNILFPVEKDINE